ncbi:MAG: OsmC family protein [Chlorobiaceae bacterium]|nr:OsmC family protein [Chlorobiaceae bacterium]NTW75209.1 OsmC family protein [Chlorobiaceae bacterium]
MHVLVTYNGKLPLVGSNDKRQKTRFDATLDPSEPARHASPMEVLLESLAACSLMDVIMILGKKKKTVAVIRTQIEAERADVHPRVFTAIHLAYTLKSPDCPPGDFRKAVELSIDKYCSVAAMIRNSGCNLTWSTEVTG